MAESIYKKPLSELLTEVEVINEVNTLFADVANNAVEDSYGQKAANITITHLALDSRKVQQGSLFFACSGAKADGRDYIADAINRGAVAILVDASDGLSATTEAALASLHEIPKTPIFYVPNLRHLIGKIAAKFYEYPSRHMTVIGVTGTNGKTSCCQFIAQLLQAQHIKCGIIGTIGCGYPERLEPTINTTPDPITLQEQLARFYCEGAKAVAMEVSSHSLVQERVAGIEFKLAVFTNLTRDHLDYHGDMEQYGAAKRRLFLQPNLQAAIINADDNFGVELIKELSDRVKIYAYSLRNERHELENISSKIPVIKAQNIVLSERGIESPIITPWGDGELTSTLWGRFNLSNLLAALGVLGIMECSVASVLSSMTNIQPPVGRMQILSGKDQMNWPSVVVDYAHTPDALEKALTALREHCSGALWCVFGCGGEKDRGKRSMMGQIAERYSDNVIITDDNPRHENAEQIVDDIVAGLLCPWAVEIEHDRRVAIMHALNCAKASDVVLIAGKGHEGYQIIGDERIPFNDLDVVKAIQGNFGC